MKSYLLTHNLIIKWEAILLASLAFLYSLYLLDTYFKYPDMFFNLINTVAMFLLGFIMIVPFFLLFPAQFFPRWVKYVASWYLPLAIFLAFSWFKPISGNIINPSRGLAIGYMMMILGIITFVFLMVNLIMYWKDKKNVKKN